MNTDNEVDTVIRQWSITAIYGNSFFGIAFIAIVTQYPKQKLIFGESNEVYRQINVINVSASIWIFYIVQM